MVDLCLDVVFTHGPQLFVKLGRYLMGAEVLDSLRGEKQRFTKLKGINTTGGGGREVNRSIEIPGRAPLDCT